jgi:hypothetical protein
MQGQDVKDLVQPHTWSSFFYMYKVNQFPFDILDEIQFLKN